MKTRFARNQTWFKVAAVVTLGSLAWKVHKKTKPAHTTAVFLLYCQEAIAIDCYLDSEDELSDNTLYLYK